MERYLSQNDVWSEFYFCPVRELEWCLLTTEIEKQLI